ncbi:MAG: response regulator [Deltaproteobacteria bacterium]|nr:response regulator [Deltaproteobacteria bacterium]
MSEQQSVPAAPLHPVVVGRSLALHPTRGDPPAVLIIDIDDELRREHRRALAAAGWQVTVAASGNAGLRFARACPVDVVVVDARLPDVDGWGLLAAMRGDAHLCEARVVLMSDSDDWLEQLEAVGVGADAGFAKGLAPEGLVNVVERSVATRFGILRALEGDRGDGVAGTLGDVGVKTLLQGICDTKRRGRLEVNTGSSTWFVDVDAGVIARVALCCPGEDANDAAVVDRAALLDLLSVGDAPWSFESVDAVPPRTLGVPWSAVASELCDQLNERRVEVQAALLSRPRPVALDAARLGLWLSHVGPGPAAIAEALMKGVPPRDLIAGSLRSPLEVDAVVQDLLRRGVLLLWPEPDAAPVEKPPPAPVRPAMKQRPVTSTIHPKRRGPH